VATASHPDQSSTGHPLPARGAGILGIETSQARGSVAWAAPGSDGTVSITELLFPVGLVHGREILPTIDALSERVPFDREEIGVVAVSVGPGSFTGARIGVAAAKALAWGLCARLLAVSSLEVIARGLLETERDGEPSPLLGAREAREVAVLIDARRSLLYGGRFTIGPDGCARRSEDEAAEAEGYLEALPPETMLVGEGARTLPGVDRFPTCSPIWDEPRASTVTRIAAERIEAIRGGDPPPTGWLDPHALIPRYLRRTSAEEVREAKERGA